MARWGPWRVIDLAPPRSRWAARRGVIRATRTKPLFVDRRRRMNLRLMDRTSMASDTRPVPSPGAPVT